MIDECMLHCGDSSKGNIKDKMPEEEKEMDGLPDGT